MILRDADSPVCEDRAGFTTQRNRNAEKSCSIHHLELMLRLVESLATKDDRLNRGFFAEIRQKQKGPRQPFLA